MKLYLDILERKENLLVILIFFLGVILLGLGFFNHWLIYIGSIIIGLDYIIHTLYRLKHQRLFKKNSLENYNQLENTISKKRSWKNVTVYFEKLMDIINDYQGSIIGSMTGMELNKKLREKIFSEQPRPQIAKNVFEAFLAPTFMVDFYLPQKYFIRSLEGAAEIVWLSNKMDFNDKEVILSNARDNKQFNWEFLYELIEFNQDEDLRNNLLTVLNTLRKREKDYDINIFKENKKNKIVYLFFKSCINLLTMLWESPLYLDDGLEDKIKNQWIIFQKTIVKNNIKDIFKRYKELTQTALNYCQIPVIEVNN